MDDTHRMEYEGKQAPAVVYETAQGKPWRLSDQRGKVVLIEHWATWIIDRDGKVLGTNLRGAAVAKKLKSVMSH